MIKDFAILKENISKKICESIIKEEKNTSVLYDNFLNTLETSPILMLEYNTIKNIESKILEESKIDYYIEKNISIFNKFNYNDLKEAHKKLNKFNIIKKEDVDEDKILLYESIENLIFNNLSDTYPDIDKIHESYEFIHNYMKNNNYEESNEESNEQDNTFSMDFFFSKINEKFKEKYKNISEKKLKEIKTIIEGDTKEKEKLFEDVKKRTINFIIENFEDKNNFIEEAVTNIENIKFNESDLIENIKDFYEILEDQEIYKYNSENIL